MPSRKSLSNPLDRASLRALFFRYQGMQRFREQQCHKFRLVVDHHCSPAEVSHLLFGDQPPRKMPQDYVDFRLTSFTVADMRYAVVIATLNGEYDTERLVIDPFPYPPTGLADVPQFEEEM